MVELEPNSIENIKDDTLQKLPGACRDIVDSYIHACGVYGLNPGIVRLFVVGSIIKDGGKSFGTDSDVDFIFSVENPELSLSALPIDAESKSSAEFQLESRHERLLEKFDEIWNNHEIIPPPNVPHGESDPRVWGMNLMTNDDFPDEQPGVLFAEYIPNDSESR